MCEHVKKTNDRNEKVIKFEHPSDMKQRLDLEIPKEPLSLVQIVNDCQNVIDNAVKTGSPISCPFFLYFTCKFV